jgi:hypothetical protein
MDVGFTGSGDGCTVAQLAELARLLASFRITRFRHGDCAGADAIAHGIVLTLPDPPDIEIHPPLNESKRAFCQGWTVMHDPKEYLDRDDDIARSCDLLIATPDSPDEQLRSGTWATVRYARKHRKLVIRVNPDGSTRTG